MLAQAEMPVVIALNEKISLGISYRDDGEETDVKGLSICKVPQ